jgi:hypothetical protein
MGRLRGDGGAPVVGRSGVMGLVSRLVPCRGAVLEHMDKMAVHFTLDAALKAFTQRVMVFFTSWPSLASTTTFDTRHRHCRWYSQSSLGYFLLRKS